MLISSNKHKVSGFGCQVSENRRQRAEDRISLLKAVVSRLVLHLIDICVSFQGV